MFPQGKPKKFTLTANSKSGNFYFPEGLSEINSDGNGVTRAAILQQGAIVIIFDIYCYQHWNWLFYNTDVKSVTAARCWPADMARCMNT